MLIYEYIMIGWYHKEPPQGIVKLIKLVKYNSWATSFNFFTIVDLIFSCLPIACQKYMALRFQWNKKWWELL